MDTIDSFFEEIRVQNRRIDSLKGEKNKILSHSFTISGVVEDFTRDKKITIHGIAIPMNIYDEFTEQVKTEGEYRGVYDESIVGIISKPKEIVVSKYYSELKQSGFSVQGEQIELDYHHFNGRSAKGDKLYTPDLQASKKVAIFSEQIRKVIIEKKTRIEKYLGMDSAQIDLLLGYF